MNCAMAAFGTDLRFLSPRTDLAVLSRLACLKPAYLEAWLGLQDLLPWLMWSGSLFLNAGTCPEDYLASLRLAAGCPQREGPQRKQGRSQASVRT